eukprot:TRINITY_DN235_c4_g1_i1.p1 TRINITY_DN235_c4_g1~~TRINITY_DN235_c4_g1_i1.p1  ORF type:complete len:244 (-),score=52.07 TRINITY_DN235_c4_g1_i1:105-836(-)
MHVRFEDEVKATPPTQSGGGSGGGGGNDTRQHAPSVVDVNDPPPDRPVYIRHQPPSSTRAIVKVPGGSSVSGEHNVTRWTFGECQDLVDAANRIWVSKGFVWFYAIMIVLNCMLISWVIFHTGNEWHWVFLTLELMVTMFFTIEVTIRLLKVWNSEWQFPLYLDLFVWMLCVGSLILYYEGSVFLEEEVEEIASSILVFRYCIIFLRLLIVLRNQHKNTAADSVIDFNTITDIEDPLHENLDC